MKKKNQLFLTILLSILFYTNIEAFGTLNDNSYLVIEKVDDAFSPTIQLDIFFFDKYRYWDHLPDLSSFELIVSDQVNLLDTIFKNGLVAYSVAVADSLKAIQAYSEALEVLYQANVLVQDSLFENAAKELILLDTQKILEDPQPNPFPLFAIAENKWGIHIDNDDWYRETKTKLLKDYFLRGLKNDSDNRFEILSEIFIIDPDDITFRSYFYTSKGDRYLSQHQHLLAAEAYLEIFDVGSAPETLKNSLLQAIRGLFRERHLQQEFEIIYRLGLQTYDLFKNEFQLLYYFGNSCRQMQDFQRAYNQYVFLINNWTDNQRIVSWDELLSSLEELSVQTRHFERALNTNIRIQRDKGGAEQVENYLLNTCIADYYLLSRLLSVCLARIGTGSRLDKIDQHYPGEIPPGLNGIYIINLQSEIINVLYKKTNISPPAISRIGDSKELILRRKTADDFVAHLIKRLDENQFLVIELRNTKTALNSLMMRNILDNNMSNSPWDLLRKEERLQNIKRTAIVFANAVQQEIHLRRNLNLNAYWRAVSGLNIKYMVVHNVNGSIFSSENFSATKVVYMAGGWERSSATQAYFEQSVTYDGQKVIDIAIPLFSDNNFTGVLRMGFLE